MRISAFFSFSPFVTHSHLLNSFIKIESRFFFRVCSVHHLHHSYLPLTSCRDWRFFFGLCQPSSTSLRRFQKKKKPYYYYLYSKFLSLHTTLHESFSLLEEEKREVHQVLEKGWLYCYYLCTYYYYHHHHGFIETRR